MIISTALKEDIGELTDLWQTCFGDDDDYIGAFMRSRSSGARTGKYARRSICLTVK